MFKTLILTRKTLNKPSKDRVQLDVQQIIERVVRHKKNWQGKLIESPIIQFDEKLKLYVSQHKVRFSRVSGHERTAEKQWEQVLGDTIKCGMLSRWREYKWIVEGTEADKIRSKLEDEGKIPSRLVAQPELGITVRQIEKTICAVNTELGDHFDHIYDRNDQIKIIHSAIVAGKDSEWENRFHCVLFGPPGCGKSDILLSMGHMLGKENEAYLKFDATSTTEAGAQRILLESSYIPPVFIVEEIEKQEESKLRWMLSILDHRAEVRKANFRTGLVSAQRKMLCLATVNDLGLFKRVLSGALCSRFAHEIYCPRPDREILRRILEREVSKVSGNRAWIEPTLKFCFDEHRINDPRKIVPVCLCGKDALLDGSYQESLLRTQRPKDLQS